MTSVYWALVAFLLFMVVLSVLELVSRKRNLQAENVRRASHAVSAVFVAVLGVTISGTALIVLLSVFIPIMWYSKKRRILNHIHGVTRPTIGEELLPLGFIVAYVVAGGDSSIFLPAVLILGFADPITGFVVERYNNHIYGFVCFMIVALLITLTFGVTISAALPVAFVAAASERLFSYGFDNITIPFAASLMLRLI